MSASSVALVHRSSTLLADDIAAPVELALAILCFPFGVETSPTAEHVAATGAGAVGALPSSGAQ